jgi:ubiquitin
VQLEDEQVLAEAGVSDDSTLMCMLRLLGGAKKRKKKTYTKPKKLKHKHQKIKLRVLKFYKVGLLCFSPSQADAPAAATDGTSALRMADGQRAK